MCVTPSIFHASNSLPTIPFLPYDIPFNSEPKMSQEPQIRRLYLDNAATSFPKPREVLESMTHYATELGASAGRGAYREAVETGGLITQCRHRLNKLFHGEKSEHFIFTLNCSDAL